MTHRQFILGYWIAMIVVLVLTLVALAVGGVWLQWDESPDPNVTGYRIKGGDYSSLTPTNQIFVGKTNRIPDPGWLFVQVNAFNSAGAESDPIFGQRARVTRSGNTNRITFVPLAGRTSRVELSSNLANWQTIAAVTGSSQITVTSLNTAPQQFYRIKSP